MQKKFWIVIILAVIIAVLLGILLLLPTKKTPQPVVSGIEIISPKSEATVSLPIKITGMVNGNGWAGFEGQVGMVELKQNNVLLSRTFLKAVSDWTVLPTYFEADLTELLVDCVGKSDCLLSGNAELVFHNENPSGDPAKDKTFILPVKLK